MIVRSVEDSEPLSVLSSPGEDESEGIGNAEEWLGWFERASNLHLARRECC